ncbi:MAG: hypothetical protein NWT08_06075 [Akkermansiaceae bacterium]|nr:hypothetical protein [Akkermansiaceae bacterium]MDP4645821.1 hypothetical protein [Akkermansiaceae bacterium]MDP4720556.1 hypothetical protein [Akkermansiaceae bacterium]MDP4779006.1 hypothetical protein [Akkermansiaceae bacterium]MDP4847990.1 hypothetical protein [Akkermansiaceae bacterium]
MKKNDHPHIGLAIATAGVMALGLAVGLKLLGLMARIDAFFLSAFSPDAMKAPERPLEPVILWAATALLAFALPAVILNVPGLWRRLIIWGVTIGLTFSWGPVLVLASRMPEIGVALVAVLWSGSCAMFYTINHVLPVDLPEIKNDNHAKS